MLAVFIVGWAIAILIDDRVRFAIITREGQASVESAAALSRLFGAFVLLLFPHREAAERLRWIAVGLFILALGGVIFGITVPFTDYALSANARLYVGW